jgi:phage terminase large subunit-like protein
MSRDYVAIADKYAKDVVSGKQIACRYVRLVCQRFIEDKKRKGKDFPYRLDEAKATKVCRFVELMPHIKGKWAQQKEFIQLQPWQCFIIVNVFGWISKESGLRRYRRVYIEVPRKNAKSTTTAAIANYMLAEDGEHGAEVYSGATTEKQAWEVFGPARLMAQKTPELVRHYGIDIGAKNLNIRAVASKFEPIVGKPGDGASPSFSITDEYHEHPTSEQYDTMVTGMGAREQPIAWVITTAGSNTAGPCFALRTQATDSIEGKIDHDELFSLIYTVDEDTDWTSEDALRMANPNMGVSVFADFLRTEQQRAIKSPREQAKFKTKHLDIWVTAASPYFNSELWNRLGDKSLVQEAFIGEPCAYGLDLASRKDIAGYAKLFQRIQDGKPHFYVFGEFYVPEALAEDPEYRHYAEWVTQGHLKTTPGDSTDFDYIEADIKADGDRFPVLRIGIDPWNARQVAGHLGDHFGADKILEVPQTVAHLSFPMKEVQAAIDDGRMHHNGNPAFGWMIGNVTAQEDRNGNVFPRKESAERKIDAALMLIIAMNPSVGAFEQTEPMIHFLNYS